MAKILFNAEGRYLLGKHKGTLAGELDAGFVEWAGKNIDGFSSQYAAIARGELPREARPVSVRPFSQERPKRRYFLSKNRRMYDPRPPE